MTNKISLIKYSIMINHFIFSTEEQVSSAERASSPIGKKNEKTPPNDADSQPTTDPWPPHTDESDIDRLVAMHQNRHNSLSSLGVRTLRKKEKNNLI